MSAISCAYSVHILCRSALCASKLIWILFDSIPSHHENWGEVVDNPQNTLWDRQQCKAASWAEAQLFLLESIASWMDQSLEFGLRCDSPDQARWWPPWVLKQRIATRSDSDGIGMGFRLQLSFEILKGSAHLQEDEKLDDTPKSRTEIEIPSGRWTHCGHNVSQRVTTCHKVSQRVTTLVSKLWRILRIACTASSFTAQVGPREVGFPTNHNHLATRGEIDGQTSLSATMTRKWILLGSVQEK